MTSVRALACTAVLAVLAGCSDGGGITQTDPAVPPPNTLAAIPCSADLHAQTLTCGGGPSASPTLHADRLFGGQRVNVLVQSSNVAYDSVTHLMSADVTVQNLLVQRMGSDGATVSGVKVFFASGPTTTAGTGQVELNNADGIDIFTATGQPYYLYPGALPPQAVTAPRRWEFAVGAGVQTFAFTVYVATPTVPAIVVEMSVSGNRDLFRMGIDGNDTTRLTTSVLSDLYPTVAKGTVVFTSYRNGNAELYSVPVKGGTETRLTATTGINETAPALSPDGTKLAWTRGAPGAITKVWAGNADATGGAAVAPASDAIESSPRWASSSQLAFTSSASGSADVWGVTLGGTPAVLAGGNFAEVEPAYSPDGTRMAFASNRTGDTELYILTLSTGLVTRLTTRTGSDGAPTWLSDGRVVYTCTTGTTFRLCIVDPANPAGAAVIPTPFPPDHAAAILF